ncbi:MAG: DUF1634 domain-containing protein [Chloroflexi bacterium]|nr:DUF1634 domain-containing protein [Chloroflexota bacterium]
MAECQKREISGLQVERVISSALRYGVLASSVLVAAGVVAFLLSIYHGGLGQPTTSSLLSSNAEATGVLRSPGEVLHGLWQGDPNAVIALGLLLLMVTPVVPVVLSAVSFLLERDRAYVLITLLVLAILAASFLLGAAR